jgi:hypothetical protein
MGPLGTHPPRGGPTAIGEGAFTGWATPRGLRRELPLGEGSAVRKQPFTERVAALGEGLQSRSA